MARKPFDVREFAEWCRSKPADERYYYGNVRECALGQFGRETNRSDLIGASAPASLGDEIWDALNPGIRGINASNSPLTFGALADRLEKQVQA